MMRILIANVVAISIVATASASAEEPVMGPRRAAEASDEGEVAHLRTRASGGKATAGAIDGGARGLRGGKNRGKGAKSGKGGAKSGKGGAKSGKGGGGGGLFGGMLPENLCIVEPCPHHLSVYSSICGCSEKGETCVPDEEGDGTWGLCVASSAKSGKAGGGGGGLGSYPFFMGGAKSGKAGGGGGGLFGSNPYRICGLIELEPCDLNTSLCDDPGSFCGPLGDEEWGCCFL